MPTVQVNILKLVDGDKCVGYWNDLDLVPDPDELPQEPKDAYMFSSKGEAQARANELNAAEEDAGRSLRWVATTVAQAL